MEFLTQYLNGFLENKYLQAAAIFIAFFIAAKIFHYIFIKIFAKIALRTKTNVDDLLIKKTNMPIYYIIILVGLRLAFITIGFSERVNSFLNDIIGSFVIFFITLIVIIIIDVLIEEWGKDFAKRTKSKVDVSLLNLFHKFSRVILMIIGLIFVLSLWEIKVGPLLASLGIAGIAVAFALQNTLGNIFGGISLILDKAIKKGDIVKLETGETGKIYDIGIRSTRIQTWDNEMIMIPNGKLAGSIIQNYSQPELKQRITLEVGVEYGSDPDKVKKVIYESLKKTKGVLKEPAPFIHFYEMGDFALKFKVLFWIESLSEKFAVYNEVITNVYKELKRHKIRIPFPTRTVFMKK